MRGCNQKSRVHILNYCIKTVLMAIRSIAARVPTGFIVTGPNISSHSLLFKQLSTRLKTEINGPTVILRSSDMSNLKAVLKQLIRDATNQRTGNDDEEGLSFDQDVGYTQYHDDLS